MKLFFGLPLVFIFATMRHAQVAPAPVLKSGDLQAGETRTDETMKLEQTGPNAIWIKNKIARTQANQFFSAPCEGVWTTVGASPTRELVRSTR